MCFSRSVMIGEIVVCSCFMIVVCSCLITRLRVLPHLILKCLFPEGEEKDIKFCKYSLIVVQ